MQIKCFFMISCFLVCSVFLSCSQGEGKARVRWVHRKPVRSESFIKSCKVRKGGDIDRWGGCTKIRNPCSKYMSGIATEVTCWTLTDTAMKWKPDDLRGCILQPAVDKEFYFLIKSNSKNKITVYGSKTSSDEDHAYKCVSDAGEKGIRYAVLDRWSVHKVNKRWLLFDPYGNAFIIKSINGYCYENHRYGNDHNGDSFCRNIQKKHRTDDCYEALQMEIDTVKKIGFNCWGEIVDLERTAPGGPHDVRGKISARYQPFIASIRINSLDLKRTGAMYMKTAGKIWDACDSDFQDDIMVSLLSGRPGARSAGIQCFDDRRGWRSYYLTPYRSMKYNIPANPYYIGLDWDEEPAYCRSESATEHIGYYLLISNGSEPRKIQVLRYLRQKYSSIQQLNVSWGSSFSGWKDLLMSSKNSINRLLSSEPYCRDFGRYKEKNRNMKADLDGIAEDFWRIYCKKVHDALDTLTAAHVLNFGPGYHGWIGRFDAGWEGCASPEYLFRGSVSADGSFPYIDIIGIGDPMHGQREDSTDIFGTMKKDLIKRYAFHGRPYWHESCWVTAEADSGIAYTGRIESVTAHVLYDKRHDFRTGNNWDTAFSTRGGLWILTNPRKYRGKHVFFRIDEDGSSNGSLRVDLSHGPGNSWAWDRDPDLRKHASIGDTYVLVTHDALAHIGRSMPASYSLHIPLSQEERAHIYVKFLEELIRLRAYNGDYIDVGFSHWEFFDYAFRKGGHEMRNWGFETVRGNLYNGSEATVKNGEIQDCGDFVGPVRRKLLGIYGDIQKIK